MSISAIMNSSAAVKVSEVFNELSGTKAATGGGVSSTLGAGAAGGYIAQPAGNGSLVKKMLAGAVVGAGVGFAAAWINPVGRLVGKFIPHAKIIVPAAGAAIGAIAGLVVHIRSRKSNLPLQPPAAPNNIAPPRGKTLRIGSKGPAVATLQRQLNSLGLYRGKATGRFDKATAAAIKKYEIMKGVEPTGLGAADLRAAVAQDVRLMRQYT